MKSKKALALTLTLVIALCVVVKIVHAYSEHWYGSVYFLGESDSIRIDVDGDDDIEDEVFMYVGTDGTSNAANLAGFASGHPTAEDRGEILIHAGEAGQEEEIADVWIKSSAGAKVLVDQYGDVIITLGN